MPSEKPDVTCFGDSDDCTGKAVTLRDTSGGNLPLVPFCASCATAYDVHWANYDGPGDPDGEDVFRDYRAEERDRMDEARRLK